MHRRIRLGMIGGGQGAFIGAVHRIAARLDDEYELVAGAFSSSPQKSLASGQELRIPPERCYADFNEMLRGELKRDDRVEAVAIVTPNHLHAGPAAAFLGKGIHVLCDKPLAATPEQAQELASAAAKSEALFILTHTYSGYPMVRQAREMVDRGAIGQVRIVQVEYIQDWLTEAAELDRSNKQASWRTDPERSGPGGAVGDIGTHAYHLACFVSGLEARSLAADLHTFVSGRRVDDNGHVLVRFRDDARGMIWFSQVAPGNDNSVKVRVFGDKGGLEWSQNDANCLSFSPYGEPKQILSRRGHGSLSVANSSSRTPSGHPEGYLEAFANIYRDAAQAIRSAHSQSGELSLRDLPTLCDGLKGMSFIAAAMSSSRNDAVWTNL